MNNYQSIGKLLTPFALALVTSCATNTYKAEPMEHVNIGAAQLRLGYYNSARRELQSALLKNPNDPIAHYELGRLDAITGDMHAALGHFYRVIEKYPFNASAHTNIGWTLVALGNHKEAKRHFEKARVLGDELSSAHAGLGAIYLQQSQNFQAEKSLRRSLKKNPGDPFANLYLGLLYEGGDRINSTSLQRGLRQAVRLAFQEHSQVTWDARFKYDKTNTQDMGIHRRTR